VVNDVEVACVAGSNLRDTVISSLYWLVQELDKQGAQLCAGQTVLCGTIAGMHGVDAEDTVRVVTADFGSVCMRLT
jgi:2-keto-4-pentenoate hydratase